MDEKLYEKLSETAGHLEAWQMTKDEYNTEVRGGDGENKVLVANLGGGRKVMVYRNPTSSDYKAIRHEVYGRFLPKNPKNNDPASRHTIDMLGNRYIWAAPDATHDEMENGLEARFGLPLSQNDQREPHKYVIRDAVAKGLSVPDHVLEEYVKMYDWAAREMKHRYE